MRMSGVASVLQAPAAVVCAFPSLSPLVPFPQPINEGERNMSADIAGTAGRQHSSLGRVMLASAIGSALEWYDFFIYGTAAALVFNELFFPKLDPRIGTLAAFATFGVGFFARPFGGLVFGHFGDGSGSKPMLVMTLLLVGIATFLIGLVPTYEQIGVWAPV